MNSKDYEKCLVFQFSQIGMLQEKYFFGKLNEEVVKCAEFQEILLGELGKKMDESMSYKEAETPSCLDHDAI